MRKHIAILGSTGSIGKQTLEVINNHPDHFKLEVLTAGTNAECLIDQSRRFLPSHSIIANSEKYELVRTGLSDLPIKVHAGYEAIEQIVEMDSIDMVLTAIVGFSGLIPTLKAIKAGKQIAIANKESLVVAGDLIMKSAREMKVKIIPVDSEHSAIFQSIVGEEANPIEKVILTASGGPFLGWDKKSLKKVTRKEALKHPNWRMGNKITIDSATLMNKGLEVIEARWLFELEPGQIEVVVHPQSIIHSMVQFEDGSIKAQMGLPDMKLPIQYALGYPKRLKSDYPRFDFLNYPELIFQLPDTQIFKSLNLAYEALHSGGNMPCTLNAANEIAVNAFLQDKLAFLDIPFIIEKTMQTISFISNPDINDYINTNSEARKIAGELVFK